MSREFRSELSDLKLSSTSSKSNKFQDDLQQQNFENIEHSDVESVCSLSTTIFINVNGKERNFSWDKKPVVELCDFMVCSRKYCDLPKFKSYEKLQLHKKKKTEQQFFQPRKRNLNRIESTSDVDDVSNNEEVVDVEEISKDDAISDISVVRNKSDSDYEEEEESEEEITSEVEDADDSDWEEKFLSRKKKRKIKEKESETEISCEVTKTTEENNNGNTVVRYVGSRPCGRPRKGWIYVKDDSKKLSGDSTLEPRKTENLSSYELIRQKHMEDKMAFLKSLMMNEIVDELEETAKSQKQKKPIKRKLKTDEILQASRKSERTNNINMNYSEAALQDKAYANASTSTEKPELPSLYSFKDAFCGENEYTSRDHEKYFLDLEIEENTTETNFSHDLGLLDPSVFTSEVFPFHLTGITFHPAVDRTILLGASTCGKIFLWNVDTEPYVFTPHLNLVTHIKVNPNCPSEIISSSKDGTLRKTDIEKKCFVEVYKGDTPCKYFDFVTPKEILVAHYTGFVSLVDCREHRSRSGFMRSFQGTALWSCPSTVVRTISAHPTRNLYLTLDSAGFMKVWDLRFQKKSVTCCQLQTKRDVISALFSPVTGNSILCSSKRTISMFDSSRLDEKLKLQWKIDNKNVSSASYMYRDAYKYYKRHHAGSHYCSHSNAYTTANWLPRSDSAFIVSNNAVNRTLILQSEGGQYTSSLYNSKQITALQDVHPVRNMLAVTSLTGKRHSRISLFLKEIHA